MKLHWDATKYTADKPMCMLLKILFPMSGNEFRCRLHGTELTASIKKPAIQEVIFNGGYAWVDPVSKDGKTYLVHFADTIHSYRPIVTPATAHELLPQRLFNRRLSEEVRLFHSATRLIAGELDYNPEEGMPGK